MRRLIPAAAAIAVVAFLIWAFLPRPVEVELAKIDLRPLEVAVEEEGEAQIREVFTVSATIAGKLQRISLHAGDEVAEGDTVAAIGPAAPVLLDSRARAVAEATAAAAQAAMDLARAQLAQAEAMRDFATSEVNRATALYERGRSRSGAMTTPSVTRRPPAPPSQARSRTSPCGRRNWKARWPC